MKTALLTFAGIAALAFGGVGLLLPVWPTTPFVLIAAGCFASGNPHMYSRLARSRYFGEFVRNYKEHTGVSRHTKIVALCFLWGMLILSMFFIAKPVMYVVLSIIGAAVSIHILLLKTKTS